MVRCIEGWEAGGNGQREAGRGRQGREQALWYTSVAAHCVPVCNSGP